MTMQEKLSAECEKMQGWNSFREENRVIVSGTERHALGETERESEVENAICGWG